MMRNVYFGGPEDGVGRGRKLGLDPVSRFPSLQMNHADLGQFLPHVA
jgi:hypothetical protein